MITAADVAFYRENGYLVVPGALTPGEVAGLAAATERLVEAARGVAANDEVYDLEDTHGPAEPRVRRLKGPHRLDPAYEAAMRHPRILAILDRLWGGRGVRFDNSKLNMKAAGYGAPVEWHQDWAFYPHTNDDLAAVGVMIDEVGRDNGPMMVIPGSHKGPIHDHHADGCFCGAIDPTAGTLDFAAAVPLTGPAGSLTIHHVRLVHGSAPNESRRPRRFLLLQYRAADAWPILGVKDFAAFEAMLLAGEPTREPRLTEVPVRLPLPLAPHQGSIYENQRTLGHRYFRTPAGHRHFGKAPAAVD